MKQSIYNFFSDIINVANKGSSRKLQMNKANDIKYHDSYIIVAAMLTNQDQPYDNNQIKFFSYNQEDDLYESIGVYFVFDDAGILIRSEKDDTEFYVSSKSEFFNISLEHNIPFSFEDIVEIKELMNTSNVKIQIRYTYEEELPYGY